MRLFRRLLPLLAALALARPAAAAADERILQFTSSVQVARDGTLDVAETIRLRSEGETIRRGIQRDFPTRYRNAAGREIHVGFDLVEVRRDGASEPWEKMAQANGIRIRIGSADRLLPAGEHEYLIRYRTTRQIGFFGDYDELYWNATGTGWTFPIDVAEARIRLPTVAPFGRRAAYTGTQGARDTYAMVVSEQPGDILFRTTAQLAPHEGLTVAVAWPKGVVSSPAKATAARLWLQDNGPPAEGVAALLGLLGWYFQAWRRAGRGPRAGTVVPIFTPPDGLSPAAVRYIGQMGTDNRTFAAALIDLGVRRRLRLVEGEKHFFKRAKTTIERTGDGTGFPAPEAAMMSSLFSGGDAILMDDSNHAIFSAAQSALGDGLKAQYEGKMFVRNRSWSIRGTVVAFVAVWLVAGTVMLAAPEDYSRGAIAACVLGLGGLVIAFLLYLVGKDSEGSGGLLVQLLAGIVGMTAAAAGLVTIKGVMEAGRVVPLLIPLLALPVVISAFWWMAAPTREGRRVLDRIAGFRQYLEIAEEDRLQTMHPPEKTPELFERYLPYAIALKVENAWAARFASVLAAAAAEPNRQTMAWYLGSSDPWSNPGRFANQIGDSLTSTIASASTAPGSSSGSGGGGFSGGGGGGGGGSGW